MKAHWKGFNGRLIVEVEGPNAKAIFEELSAVQSALDADSQCGACQSTNIEFRVRTVDNNKYYELSCRDCRSALKFGQHRTGDGLFPKRKGEDDQFLPDNGWVKYVPRLAAERRAS